MHERCGQRKPPLLMVSPRSRQWQCDPRVASHLTLCVNHFQFEFGWREPDQLAAGSRNCVVLNCLHERDSNCKADCCTKHSVYRKCVCALVHNRHTGVEAALWLTSECCQSSSTALICQVWQCECVARCVATTASGVLIFMMKGQLNQRRCV